MNLCQVFFKVPLDVDLRNFDELYQFRSFYHLTIFPSKSLEIIVKRYFRNRNDDIDLVVLIVGFD
jgi:hypothetical protein